MRLGAIPQSVNESIALAAGLVPTHLIDTLAALLLAKTIMAATAVGIFQALEREPLTTDEIAKRCGSDPQGTTKLVWALFACRYLKQRGSRLLCSYRPSVVVEGLPPIFAFGHPASQFGPTFHEL